ncbi:hypothetical protein KCP77_14535 [Salmonella enterica subsp. enterica]|nr:hypothetical protein KCP77_14535 [Salmonella enterica subsp. enterica]
MQNPWARRGSAAANCRITCPSIWVLKRVARKARKRARDYEYCLFTALLGGRLAEHGEGAVVSTV